AYSNEIMDHFINPRNVGEIEDADGVGVAGNPVCGDVMQITIKVENDVITDAKFKTFGCAAAIASSSMATQMIIGKNVLQAQQFSNKQVIDELGNIPKNKIHCSILAEEAVHKAIEDYLKRKAN
ncbi:MAG: iron-sulfur cluster assembly scaffold protein, partial [candidate division KSB1 bacterium]|nr:iron-sulfur cluster assembly scaffold protein [candidate division KSB1 bacterium]